MEHANQVISERLKRFRDEYGVENVISENLDIKIFLGRVRSQNAKSYNGIKVSLMIFNTDEGMNFRSRIVLLHGNNIIGNSEREIFSELGESKFWEEIYQLTSIGHTDSEYEDEDTDDDDF